MQQERERRRGERRAKWNLHVHSWMSALDTSVMFAAEACSKAASHLEGEGSPALLDGFRTPKPRSKAKHLRGPRPPPRGLVTGLSGHCQCLVLTPCRRWSLDSSNLLGPDSASHWQRDARQLAPEQRRRVRLAAQNLVLSDLST